MTATAWGTVPAQGDGQADGEVGALVGPAWRLRWRAPELALVLGERAAALAAGRRDEPVRLRAEALVVFALNRLGGEVQAAERGMAALRDAEAAQEWEVAWLLRTEVAACAVLAGAQLTGFGVLRPVLAADGVPAALRAAALIQVTDCLVHLGRNSELTDALSEADRLYNADEDLDADTRVLVHAHLRAAAARHHRRWGDLVAAVEAAEEGLALLNDLSDAGADSGQASTRLVLEQVCALLDADKPAEAAVAAEPVLGRPVRAPSAAAAGWLRLALATRLHLPAGRPQIARDLLHDAADSAARHQLDALQAEALVALSHVHEMCGELAEALASLRSAHVAERRRSRAVHAMRLRMAEEFAAVRREAAGAREQFAALLGKGVPMQRSGETDERTSSWVGDTGAPDEQISANEHSGQEEPAVVPEPSTPTVKAEIAEDSAESPHSASVPAQVQGSWLAIANQAAHDRPPPGTTPVAPKPGAALSPEGDEAARPEQDASATPADVRVSRPTGGRRHREPIAGVTVEPPQPRGPGARHATGRSRPSVAPVEAPAAWRVEKSRTRTTESPAQGEQTEQTEHSAGAVAEVVPWRINPPTDRRRFSEASTSTVPSSETAESRHWSYGGPPSPQPAEADAGERTRDATAQRTDATAQTTDALSSWDSPRDQVADLEVRPSVSDTVAHHHNVTHPNFTRQQPFPSLAAQLGDVVPAVPEPDPLSSTPEPDPIHAVHEPIPAPQADYPETGWQRAEEPASFSTMPTPPATSLPAAWQVHNAQPAASIDADPTSSRRGGRRPRAEVGLADLLTEALLAYETGRRSTSSAAEEEESGSLLHGLADEPIRGKPELPEPVSKPRPRVIDLPRDQVWIPPGEGS